MPTRTANIFATILGMVLVVGGLLFYLQTYGLISPAMMSPIIFIVIGLSVVGWGIYVAVRARASSSSATPRKHASKNVPLIYCDKCGARNFVGANYCGKCGSMLRQAQGQDDTIVY